VVCCEVVVDGDVVCAAAGCCCCCVDGGVCEALDFKSGAVGAAVDFDLSGGAEPGALGAAAGFCYWVCVCSGRAPLGG